jgi:hypothetical protein
MEIFCGNLGQHQLTQHQETDSRLKMQDVLGNLKRICILSDLDQAIGPELDRFQDALSSEHHAKLAQRCDHLRNRIQDELQNEHYFQIDRREVWFYDQEFLFGGKVGLKFKGAAKDIKNAGNCLALHQPDACVFHLMRAMEVVVQRPRKSTSSRFGVAQQHDAPRYGVHTIAGERYFPSRARIYARSCRALGGLEVTFLNALSAPSSVSSASASRAASMKRFDWAGSSGFNVSFVFDILFISLKKRNDTLCQQPTQ